METLSSFIDSSINDVLLHTNTNFTSRFLNSQTILNLIWYNSCNRLAGQMVWTDGIYWRFSFYFNTHYTWSDFPR